MKDITSTYTMRGLKEALKYLSPDQTALIRGRHGIGKSAAVYQMRKTWGIDKVIERRISQLSEGDMIGLPDRGAVKEHGGQEHPVTKFLPPDWILEQEFEPCIVFLDEINRGTPETMQACFQFIEKGELNGRKKHPETRIVAAINFSKEYHVNPLDPAFLDRFWIADLEPDKQDWIDWARIPRAEGGGEISEDTVDFIAQCNEDHFEIAPEKQAQMAAYEITPSRRSWERLDRHITRLVGDTRLIEQVNSGVLYDVMRGFVGPDAARAYQRFLQDRSAVVTPEEILKDFEAVRKRVKRLKPEAQTALIDKLRHYVVSNNIKLNDEQTKNFSLYFKSLTPELSSMLWNVFAATKDLDNLKIIHKYCARHFMDMLAETKIGSQLQKLPGAKVEK